MSPELEKAAAQTLVRLQKQIRGALDFIDHQQRSDRPLGPIDLLMLTNQLAILNALAQLFEERVAKARVVVPFPPPPRAS